MEFLLVQLLNGLGYAMLLFLMAAGLSLIFGLMNVVSLAHGSFFMLGAYFWSRDLCRDPQLLARAAVGADTDRARRRRIGAFVSPAPLSARPS